MAKHEHTIKIKKHDFISYCYGCGEYGKVTAISTTDTPCMMEFCSKCLAYLKGRLKGF